MENNSINPEVWGPHGWKFLHYVTLGYPTKPTNEDKNNYAIFFKSLSSVLPCEKCSVNYKKNIIEYPIEEALDTKEKLIDWLINIHNMVNRELKKDILSNEKAREKITKIDVKFDNYYIVIIIILLVYIVSDN